MATGFAPAEAAAILNAAFRGASYAGNASVFVQLHVGDPGAAGTANPATNTTRQQGTFGNATSTNTVANSAASTWTSVPATETYTHWSGWTASTGGTFKMSGTVSNGSVTSGNNFVAGIGSLTYTLNTAA